MQEATSTGIVSMLPSLNVVMAALAFDTLLRRAESEGLLTRRQVDSWLQDQQQRQDAERFVLSFVLFTATGRKPQEV